MSTGGSDAHTDALNQRISELEAQTNELTKALGRASNVRLVLLVGVVALVALITGLFYGMYAEFMSEQTQARIREMAQEKMQDTLQPALEREIKTLMDNSMPVLRAAAENQLKQDMPTYRSIVLGQREVLVTNLKDKLAKKLAEHQDAAMETHMAVLKEAFPSVDDETLHVKMMDNFKSALHQMGEQYYADEFQARMEEMYATWDEFPLADPAGQGEEPLEDQLLGIVIEVLLGILNSPDGPAFVAPIET